jgi:hypothetical protein
LGRELASHGEHRGRGIVKSLERGMKRIGSGNAQGAMTGRELSGLRPLVAARPRLHSNRCHPRPRFRGENEPIVHDLSDCCDTSSVAVTRWSRTRFKPVPRRAQTATRADRHPGRDRSGLDRGLASHVQLWVGGENEPISYVLSGCCKTSSALSARWSRTRSEAGPSRVHAAPPAVRHPGRDRSRLAQGLASLVRLRFGGENEPIFYDLSDCWKTCSAAPGRWSRTRFKAVPRRAQTATRAGRLPGRDGSGLYRGRASHGPPWLAGENEATFLDVSDCCKTSSAAAAKWSRTRPDAGQRSARAATREEGRCRRLDRSRLDWGLASHLSQSPWRKQSHFS